MWFVNARTHVRIKGQNLIFYLETHATTHNIYFLWRRILPRNLVYYTDVWMTLNPDHLNLKKLEDENLISTLVVSDAKNKPPAQLTQRVRARCASAPLYMRVQVTLSCLD